MDEVESGLEIDVDDSVPLSLGHPEHQTILGDACIVDQDVNPSEVSNYLTDNVV